MKYEECVVSVSLGCFAKTFVKYLRSAKYEKYIARLKNLVVMKKITMVVAPTAAPENEKGNVIQFLIFKMFWAMKFTQEWVWCMVHRTLSQNQL